MEDFSKKADLETPERGDHQTASGVSGQADDMANSKPPQEAAQSAPEPDLSPEDDNAKEQRYIPQPAAENRRLNLPDPDQENMVRQQRQLATMEQRYLNLIYSIAATPNVNAGAALKSGQADVVARMISIASKLSSVSDSEGLYRQAILAGVLFKNNPGLTTTVAAVLDDIEFSTSRNSPIFTIMRGLSYFLSAVAVVSILGAVALVFGFVTNLGVPVVEGMRRALTLAVGSPVIVSVFFGMLGSVVSILLRLSEFERALRQSRQFLLMTGAVLPLVGSIFACVTCAIFASGIINFNFAAQGAATTIGITNPYFFVVIGFLSGFSERFTRGLLGSAEKTVTAAAHIDTETRDSGGEIVQKMTVDRQVVATGTGDKS